MGSDGLNNKRGFFNFKNLNFKNLFMKTTKDAGQSGGSLLQPQTKISEGEIVDMTEAAEETEVPQEKTEPFVPYAEQESDTEPAAETEPSDEANAGKEPAVGEDGAIGEFKPLSCSFDVEFLQNNNLEYVPTGFGELDDILGGGLPTGLTILGAIPSLGKSTFALQVAQNIAANGKTVIYFSLEMSDHAIVLKAIQRKAFLKGCENPENTEQSAFSLREIMSLLNNPSDDSAKAELLMSLIEECRSETKKLFTVGRSADGGAFSGKKISEYVSKFIKTTGEVPVVIVDYLQILTSQSTKMISEKQIVDENIQTLWRLANNPHAAMPVFVMSSINRDAYNKGISFGSFKESGGIEYSADIVLGMQFAALHGKIEDKTFSAEAEKSKNPREVEIAVLKQRYGKAGKDVFTLFDFFPQYNCFIEKSKRERKAFLEQQNSQNTDSEPPKKKTKATSAENTSAARKTNSRKSSEF